VFKIGLNGIKLIAPVGVYTWEKEKGRNYVINLELEIETDETTIKDKLNQTINYEDVYDLVLKISQNHLNLVETLATTIGHAILDQFRLVKSVKIRIEKEKPMPRSNMNSVFIESVFVRK